MKNQNGLTILELLAAITICTIILVVIFSIVNQSQAEHDTQYENSKVLSKNTLVLKQLTSDLRETVTITQNPNEIIFTKAASSSTSYKFDSVQNILYRNNKVFATELKSFNLEIMGNSVKIQLENLRNELLSTTIYLRGD